VRAWLATSKKSRSQIAKETGVDEKTLRLAAKAGWNPTVKTLQKLEAMVPNGWRHKNGGQA
jgi:DNA-binding phage protein